MNGNASTKHGERNLIVYYHFMAYLSANIKSIEMPLKQVYIVIGGRVQGVGFRYFARYKAEELDITGWVKNLPDGKVEIEALGEPQDVNTFIDWMKVGPARAVIQTFSVSDINPIRNFTNFAIR